PPPHRRGDIQGTRPGPAAGDGDGWSRRRPVFQGALGVIAIVDYGVGNVHSVRRALLQVGAEAELTADAERLASADGIVFPGVGAFAPALAPLAERRPGPRLLRRPPPRQP